MPTPSARYHRIPHSTESDFYLPLQFERPGEKIPWRAIRIAIALFLLGTVLIIIALLLLSGYIDKKYSDRTWPVLALGLITFLPGFYHLRLAYCSWMGYKGYSFDDIRDYNN